MSITVFGSCRVYYVYNNNNLNHLINFTHSTKEVIQQIKFLMGELSPNEIRNIEGFSGFDGGDYHFIQSGLASIEVYNKNGGTFSAPKLNP